MKSKAEIIQYFITELRMTPSEAEGHYNYCVALIIEVETTGGNNES